MRSKAVFVNLLLIATPIVCGGSAFGPCFVFQYLVSFPVCNYFDGEERAVCFTLIFFLGPKLQCLLKNKHYLS